MYKYKFLQVGQLPREHLSFLQNPLNYFITKYLKHEVDGDLRVDKCSSCGLYNWRYKDLSMSHAGVLSDKMGDRVRYGHPNQVWVKNNLQSCFCYLKYLPGKYVNKPLSNCNISYCSSMLFVGYLFNFLDKST